MTSKCCPFCHGTGKIPDVGLELRYNTLTFKGKQIKLTAREAEVMAALMKIEVASTYALAELVYGALEPAWSRGCISVFITRLRKKLKPLKLYIKNVGTHFNVAQYMLVEI